MSIASVAVLVCCLVLTGAAILISMNVNVAMKSVENSNSVQVYLDDELSTLQGLQVGEEIKKLDNVATCEFIPKDQALEKYINMLDGDGDILNGLTGEDNPLPNAYRVSFNDLSIYKQTADEIANIKGVHKINDYSDVADKLTIMHNIVLYGGIAIVVFLAIISLLIISNTIRVTMHSRQLEISIMKSVGATSMFIRIPFLVEGALLGLFSGAVSCGALVAVYQGVVGAMQKIIPAMSFIDTTSVIGWIIVGSLMVGTLFGLSGGMLSIGKYLKQEGGNSLG